jgi:hypothetical protein
METVTRSNSVNSGTLNRIQTKTTEEGMVGWRMQNTCRWEEQNVAYENELIDQLDPKD